MTIYWANTNSAANLMPRCYESPEVENYLRENVGIDVTLLAQDVGLSEQRVMAYQRRLGLREIKASNP